MANDPLFLGIDVGTSGVRAVLATAAGHITARCELPFGPEVTVARLPEDRFEQYPSVWLEHLDGCLSRLRRQADAAKVSFDAVAAIAVTGTSGTVVPTDTDGKALAPAIMYNDSRAGDEADTVQQAGSDLSSALGYRFNSSFALPKILWLKANAPELFGRTARFLAPCDIANAYLAGRATESDHTNVLKTGYDLINDTWPDFLDDLGVPANTLPEIVPSGTVIGPICREVRDLYGFGEHTLLCAGMTDGCASQVASGAMGPGQWCTTIGTTLVIKGVSEQIAHDPEGRLYSHRHPDGFWLPGGAGNTGAKILERHVSRQDRDTFSRAALDQSPTGLATYPLEGTGERFPFVRPQARAFIVGDSGTVDMDDLVPETRFTACLEGVAMVERLAYEIIAEIGLAVDGPIRTSGGGSRNEAWLQIRADILERTLIKAAEASGAFGAAVLAASQTQFDSLHAAAAAMVQTETITEPRPEYRGRYEAQYQRFKDELTKRGYI